MRLIRFNFTVVELEYVKKCVASLGWEQTRLKNLIITTEVKLSRFVIYIKAIICVLC